MDIPLHFWDYGSEYQERNLLQRELKAITVDDLIDFHNWLRDTPDEYIFLKLEDKK